MAIFTFTYFDNKPSELNPVRSYFSDAQIVKATARAGTSEKTTECKKLMQKGYVFCQWLDIGLNLALYVKPSDDVKDYVKRVYGYQTSAMTINSVDRVIWHGVEDSIRHTIDTVAGDMDRKEFNEFVVDCLYQSKSQYMYFWIGKITNQPSAIEAFKNGDNLSWYLFDADKCFIRKNWKISNQTTCTQCGGNH